MVRRILEKIDGISRKKDNNGWTPLHLAAYFGFPSMVEQLLDKDREVAYMKDTKSMTPLHIAAQHGNYLAMKVIVERCPDCCELVDNRGWNVLHFAIKGRRSYKLNTIVDIIIENWSFSNLLNEKNADGDTPLHFYATTSSESLLKLKKFVSHPRLDEMAFNKQHLNAWDISAATEKRSWTERSIIQRELHGLPQRVITFEDEDKGGDKIDEDSISLLRNASEAHLVVATLITTVTFAACITMPGGFAGSGEGSHPGSALLKKNTAFKAFVIIDTLSMVLSSSAVFIHLVTPFFFGKNSNKKHGLYLVVLAYQLILGAMITMVLAFVTGTYAVLMHSLDLAIANCIIGLTFFVILFLVFKKLTKDAMKR
ncbi:protein ACCELERATED CELL DEATH 6-like [Corylus avellana]|nr:protein ACCELERATED CELL DEATH 6-like [Corylus avellana]